MVTITNFYNRSISSASLREPLEILQGRSLPLLTAQNRAVLAGAAGKRVWPITHFACQTLTHRELLGYNVPFLLASVVSE